MTLPNEEVMDLLRNRFVVGARNIEREKHVGLSHGYKPDQTAVGTTNGAGGRNVQIVVLAADETVLHVLPGFWHAEDLAAELRLALEIHSLHQDESVAPAQKLAMFAALHRSFLRRQSPGTTARSDWQPFDRQAELERSRTAPRDTIVPASVATPAPAMAAGSPTPVPTLKPINQVVHERMMARPFRRLSAFDMDAFVDYGRAYYDNNAGLDKGRTFARAEQTNKRREREQAKAEKAAAAASKKPRS